MLKKLYKFGIDKLISKDLIKFVLRQAVIEVFKNNQDLKRVILEKEEQLVDALKSKMLAEIARI